MTTEASNIKTTQEGLSGAEWDDLSALETTIERGRAAFLAVGAALLEIQTRRLYREGHPTFEAYLADRWKLSRAQAYRLIEASEVVAGLSPIGDIPAPTTESQARELARVAPERRDEVWAEAVERSGGEAAPARVIAEVAADLMPPDRLADGTPIVRRDDPDMIRQLFSPKAVAQAHKEARAEREQERRAERIERIDGIARGNRPLHFDSQFAVVYADPPWRYEFSSDASDAIENHYPTMDINEICALPVGDVATADAVLFLWATSPKLVEAMRVIESWGFTYRSCAVWDKQAMGMGYYFRQQHELLLVATRGDIPVPSPADRPRSIYSEAKGAHSAKPAAFAEMIERMYATLPKLEMFCRSPRAGWTAWGNQADAAAEGVA